MFQRRSDTVIGKNFEEVDRVKTKKKLDDDNYQDYEAISKKM